MGHGGTSYLSNSCFLNIPLLEDVLCSLKILTFCFSQYALLMNLRQLLNTFEYKRPEKALDLQPFASMESKRD